MLEGVRFRSQQEHNRVALAVAWGINFAFADEAQSAGMLERLGVSVEDTSASNGKATKEERLELLRNIETANVRRRYQLDIKDLA